MDQHRKLKEPNLSTLGLLSKANLPLLEQKVRAKNSSENMFTSFVFIQNSLCWLISTPIKKVEILMFAALENKIIPTI